MPSIDETTEAEIWLRATLLASSAVTAVYGTRVFSHPAPRSLNGVTVAYPLLTYLALTPRPDLMLVGTAILWANLRFLVTGYVDSLDQTLLAPGAAAVFAAIHGRFGQTANAQIVSCVRERPFKLVETVDAVQYTRLGAEYRLQVRPLSP